MYSPTVYFARVVDAAIERAPTKLHGHRVVEVEMSDVLGDLAEQGFGVAWLPDSSFENGRRAGLLPLGDGEWDIEVDVMAYCARNNTRRALMRVWERLASRPNIVEISP